MDNHREERKIAIETVIAKEIIIEEAGSKEEVIIPLDIEEKDINELNKFQFLFLFVNPISGSQEGKFIFEIFKEHGTIYEKHGMLMDMPGTKDRTDLRIFLFNITLTSSYDLGVGLLKSHLEKVGKMDTYLKKEGRNLFDTLVLIGGGDGTVLSVIENLNKRGIDEKQCIFGHIPLGTGNDLSNTLGFGCKGVNNILGQVALSSDLKQFGAILNTYVNAQKSCVDVWEMKLLVEEVIWVLICRKRERLYRARLRKIRKSMRMGIRSLPLRRRL
jgi:hypothetical protein